MSFIQTCQKLHITAEYNANRNTILYTITFAYGIMLYYVQCLINSRSVQYYNVETTVRFLSYKSILLLHTAEKVV